MLTAEQLTELKPEVAEAIRFDAQFLLHLLQALDADEASADDHIQAARECYYDFMVEANDDDLVKEIEDGWLFLVSAGLWHRKHLAVHAAF